MSETDRDRETRSLVKRTSFSLGDNEKALDAYRSARKLFEDVGDRVGTGKHIP